MGTLKQASKILSLFEEAPTEQVQVLLASGLLTDLRDGNIAEVNRNDFRKLVGLKPLNPPLLEPVGAVTIEATERFVTREKFAVDTSHKVKIKIAWIGDNFKNWFLGKIETSAPKVMLCYSRLTRSELDGPIMAELGDETSETTLAAVYALIERQANGEPGPLLTNGYANIFYVRDANGVLRAVRVYWHAYDRGWGVHARSVSYPYGWNDGNRVFSRNSCGTVTV